MRATINLFIDFSERDDERFNSIVIGCEACPSWRELLYSQREASAHTERHAKSVHNGMLYKVDRITNFPYDRFRD